MKNKIKKLNLTKVLPKFVTEYPYIRTRFRVPIEITDIKNNKIKITYTNPRGGQPKSLVLNKYVEHTSEFLVGLGIYFGDGGKTELEITNSNPKVITYALNFLRMLGFVTKELNYQLVLHEIYKDIITENEAKEFWKSHGIPHINSVHWHKKGSNKTLENHKNLPKKFGYLSIRYYSRLGGLVLYFLIKYVINNLQTKAEIIGFLQGAFAAEGSVLLQKNGDLMSVRYTTISDEKEIIRNLLETISITTKDYGSDLGIVGKENFLKLSNFEILKIKEDTWSRFENGLKLLLEPKSTPGILPDSV